jgi:O-antigen ligase
MVLEGAPPPRELLGWALAIAVAASVKIALANILLGLVAVAWVVALARGVVQWRRSTLYAPVLAYVVTTLGAAALSQDPGHSARELGELLTLGLVPVVVSLVDRQQWDRLLLLLSAVATSSSVVGLWQFVHGASTLENRLRGLNNHYMTFSGWTLVVALLLVGDIVFHPNRRRLLWTAPCCALCVGALLLSYTRNAWVGLAAGLVLVAAVWRPRALYLYPVVAVVLLVALPRGVVDRMLSIVDLRQPSNYDRLCMLSSGIGMIEDNPVFGVGLGMVERRYPVYREDDAPRWRVPHLHNNPVQIAAERGLLGLAAYAAVVVTFLVHTWRALRRPHQPAFPALAGCFLAVSGITVAGLFEYNWGDAEVWIVTLTALAVPDALVEPA